MAHLNESKSKKKNVDKMNTRLVFNKYNAASLLLNEHRSDFFLVW